MKNSKKPFVLFLVGPTASGKTAVAIEIAKKINGEIISADSMQVYRGMDILSAKPSMEEQKAVAHHLIDILEPNEDYSVAIFRQKALEAIENILSRGKIPLIVGGTGLYVKALTKGLFSDNGKDEQLRKELTQESKHKGNLHLYARLQSVDPQAAKKIHHNDMRRVIRALEVFEISSRKISELKTEIEGLDEKYDFKIFGIERERRELYQRIEQRVDQMFEAGFLDEVKNLLSKELSPTAKQALGIKQISEYLEAKCGLDFAKKTIKRDSRRFAKRQLTWFRQDKDIIWTLAGEETSPQEIAEKIISLASL
ncbi:MAG: tRNA (adenosine(37)-N6)-dimethylallyltransferase MiaA [Candidatus Omnitrophica bacterium]|nr:tRNA (adenosine(37)-N6)-dimethylallyltransferase MiaA [Candidatus Omnitrophota bacterium]